MELADASHGGKDVSNYLKDNLHGLLETVKPDTISDLMKWTISTHGGYFKRWRGGSLQRWTKWAGSQIPEGTTQMTIEERITLAFLTVRCRAVDTSLVVLTFRPIETS